MRRTGQLADHVIAVAADHQVGAFGREWTVHFDEVRVIEGQGEPDDVVAGRTPFPWWLGGVVVERDGKVTPRPRISSVIDSTRTLLSDGVTSPNTARTGRASRTRSSQSVMAASR
jgi:hypothetical protein